MTRRHPEDDPRRASEDRIQTAQRRSEEVKRLMEEVLGHPSLDALTLLEEEERFQRCDLIAALLFLGRTLGDALPPECLRGPLYTASAKLVILEDMDPEGLDASLAVHRAGAWCVVGLACHLGSNPEAAEGAYLEAARLYTGAGHRIERGTLCFLLGKLRHDTLRHDEALALLGRAVAIFGETAGEEDEAEVREAWLSSLLGIGKIHLEEGDPYQALPALVLARQRSREGGDPAACAEADLCLAWCYADLGQRSQAEVLLSEAEGFTSRVSSNRWTDLRWLQGRVEGRLGHLSRATRELQHACADLRASGTLEDAALATLELAALLVRQSRGAEARIALGELAAVFLDDDRLDAVIGALLSFLQAIEQGDAIAEAMPRTVFRLRRLARRRPSPEAAACAPATNGLVH
jgi:tetratricopeptide (TPR) repeat protein